MNGLGFYWRQKFREWSGNNKTDLYCGNTKYKLQVKKQNPKNSSSKGQKTKSINQGWKHMLTQKETNSTT